MEKRRTQPRGGRIRKGPTVVTSLSPRLCSSSLPPRSATVVHCHSLYSGPSRQRNRHEDGPNLCFHVSRSASSCRLPSRCYAPPRSPPSGRRPARYAVRSRRRVWSVRWDSKQERSGYYSCLTRLRKKNDRRVLCSLGSFSHPIPWLVSTRWILGRKVESRMRWMKGECWHHPRPLMIGSVFPCHVVSPGCHHPRPHVRQGTNQP